MISVLCKYGIALKKETTNFNFPLRDINAYRNAKEKTFTQHIIDSWEAS